MVEIEGIPVNKTSEGKQSMPGKKIVVRNRDNEDKFLSDKIYTSDDQSFVDPNNLLKLRIKDGNTTIQQRTLKESRTNHNLQMTSLPDKYKSLQEEYEYRVDQSSFKSNKLEPI
jgi:hypothetical protein